MISIDLFIANFYCDAAYSDFLLTYYSWICQWIKEFWKSVIYVKTMISLQQLRQVIGSLELAARRTQKYW